MERREQINIGLGFGVTGLIWLAVWLSTTIAGWAAGAALLVGVSVWLWLRRVPGLAGSSPTTTSPRLWSSRSLGVVVTARVPSG